MSDSRVELALARATVSPQDLFLQCAEKCQELGITTQDVYGDYTMTGLDDSSWLRRFEREVAQYCGKNDGIFLPTGVMAQGIALKIASPDRARNTFVCHYSSHLLIHEKDAYSTLLGMDPIVVSFVEEAAIQAPLNYTDVAPLLDDENKPAILIVECPHREIGGKCTSWEDLVKMSQHCRRLGIKMHMDGARLWEASAATSYANHTIGELTDLFDSIYVSFYKGLGGITGAMLIGDESYIQSAREWARRFGGNPYSLLPYAVSCWSGFKENKDSFEGRKNRLISVVSTLTREFIELSDSPFIRFDPPVPEVSLIHIYLKTNADTALAARDAVIISHGISCFMRIRNATVGQTQDECYFEMNMGPANMSISDDVWITGWRALLEYIRINASR